MKTNRAVLCFVIGILVTPVAVFLALLSGGAGHGHYELAKLFYPYTMLLTRYANDTITFPLILLALLQFPLYGAIIGLAAWKKPIGLVVALPIIVVHALFVAMCFSGLIPNFS
jgi:hypothetical protein